MSYLETYSCDYDALLVGHDDRRCVALVADGEYTIDPAFYNVWDQLEHKLHGVRWVQPTMHHTFVMLRGWKNSLHENETGRWKLIENELRAAGMTQYRVTFNQIIPVKTGIVLCGIPTVDINAVRDRLRQKGLVQGERYTLDIVHTSILRWTEPVPFEIQQSIVQWLQSLKKVPYVHLHVTKLVMAESSWCMRPMEVKTFHTVHLDES